MKSAGGRNLSPSRQRLDRASAKRPVSAAFPRGVSGAAAASAGVAGCRLERGLVGAHSRSQFPVEAESQCAQAGAARASLLALAASSRKFRDRTCQWRRTSDCPRQWARPWLAPISIGAAVPSLRRSLDPAGEPVTRHQAESTGVDMRRRLPPGHGADMARTR